MRVLHRDAAPTEVEPKETIKGSNGESFVVDKRPDKAELMAQLQEASSKGIESISVVLMHGYAFREHELIVGELACEKGFK